MEVGVLIRNRRKELGLDLRGLENKSGINHGTISRLENGKVQIFVETAIQLFEVLDLDPSKIIDPDGKGNIRIPSSIHTSKEYLNTSDLNNLIRVFQYKPLSILDKLIDLTEEFSTSETQSVFPLEAYRKIRSSHRYSNPIPELVNTLMELDYPIKLENSLIIRINNSGGVVSFLDFGHFLKNVRKELSLSLMEVQEKSGISDSTLCNLENAYYQKVKLSEILTLEKIFKSNGDLLRIIWNVHELKPRSEDNKSSAGWSPQERILLKYIISLYRWLQTNDYSIELKWLYNFRAII
jgi:transcriptional regulator with XRE-family HTH domain